MICLACRAVIAELHAKNTRLQCEVRRLEQEKESLEEQLGDLRARQRRVAWIGRPRHLHQLTKGMR